jgi:hypothetical protein
MAQMAADAPKGAAAAVHSGGTLATVFGLYVQSDRRIPFLEGRQAKSTSRSLELLVHDGEPAELDWPDSAAVICSRRDGEDPESFRIESHAEAGYLIWGRSRGSYLLSVDGRRLRCALGGCRTETWERFLIGQVLPFAALVSGLEIFHASCVALNGRAIALAGHSGAGKTSAALALHEGGARFLADDVLALEVRGDELLAHPGTALAGIEEREARRRRACGKLVREEVLMSNPRESVVRVEAGGEEASLQALFFLDRRHDGPSEPRFEPVSDPQVLLTGTFNFVLATPARLRGLLNVCALAAQRRVERIVAGPEVDASQLGAAVERRLDASA